jgi:hypothetical protein
MIAENKSALGSHNKTFKHNRDRVNALLAVGTVAVLPKMFLHWSKYFMTAYTDTMTTAIRIYHPSRLCPLNCISDPITITQLRYHVRCLLSLFNYMRAV